MKKGERFANNLDDALKCYYSDRGCFKIPVRMIVEKPTGVDPVTGAIEVEALLLCREHAASYVAKDVMIDQMIASDEMIQNFKEWGI